MLPVGRISEPESSQLAYPKCDVSLSRPTSSVAPLTRFAHVPAELVHDWTHALRSPLASHCRTGRGTPHGMTVVANVKPASSSRAGGSKPPCHSLPHCLCVRVSHAVFLLQALCTTMNLLRECGAQWVHRAIEGMSLTKQIPEYSINSFLSSEGKTSPSNRIPSPLVFCQLLHDSRHRLRRTSPSL